MVLRKLSYLTIFWGYSTNVLTTYYYGCPLFFLSIFALVILTACFGCLCGVARNFIYKQLKIFI